MEDPYNIRRFLTAQEAVYDLVLAELRAGGKRGHWMWFVFPQIKGLGTSATAQRYAIKSVEEAEAFVRHAILGERLRECTRLVNDVTGRSAIQIFGYVDSLKFRSSMTLFAHAAPEDEVFNIALIKYYDGKPDRRTLDIIGMGP